MYDQPLPKLFIFDFDGVIVDSEVISLETLRVAMQSFGIHLSLEDVREKFLGRSLKSIRKFVNNNGNKPSCDGFSVLWQTQLFNQFRSSLQLIDGVTDLLDRIEAAGLPYCVASSGSFERLDIAMTVTDIKTRFADRTFSTELVEHGKPAPDLFLYAASQMAVNPEDCLVIEDSPAGIVAAQSAGMRAIGFVGGRHLDGCREAHSEELEALGAAYVTSRMSDILLSDTRLEIKQP